MFCPSIFLSEFTILHSVCLRARKAKDSASQLTLESRGKQTLFHIVQDLKYGYYYFFVLYLAVNFSGRGGEETCILICYGFIRNSNVDWAVQFVSCSCASGADTGILVPCVTQATAVQNRFYFCTHMLCCFVYLYFRPSTYTGPSIRAPIRPPREQPRTHLYVPIPCARLPVGINRISTPIQRTGYGSMNPEQMRWKAAQKGQP